MKKYLSRLAASGISFLLAIVLALSIVSMTVFAGNLSIFSSYNSSSNLSVDISTPSEKVNYCALFENEIDWMRLFLYNDVADGEAFPIDIIIRYCEYEFKYSDEYYVEGAYTVSIPADVIENFAKAKFAIVDIDAMRTYKSYIYNGTEWLETQNYDEEQNVYVFSLDGGWGSSETALVWGYTENGDNKYTVYSHIIDFGEDYTESTGINGVDYRVAEGSRYEIVRTIKNVIETDGVNVKFHSWENVASTPAKDTLITPEKNFKLGWNLIDDNWYYYLDDEGLMAKEWYKDKGTWYYFDSWSGEMQTGWFEDIDGTWYYFDANGAMQTGWEKIGKTWYYFDVSGAMQTGWEKVGKTWYYFDASGAMQTGWKKIGKTWYYFNGSGAMLTGTQKIGGKTYRFNASGAWIA